MENLILEVRIYWTCTTTCSRGSHLLQKHKSGPWRSQHPPGNQPWGHNNATNQPGKNTRTFDSYLTILAKVVATVAFSRAAVHSVVIVRVVWILMRRKVGLKMRSKIKCVCLIAIDFYILVYQINQQIDLYSMAEATLSLDSNCLILQTNVKVGVETKDNWVKL